MELELDFKNVKQFSEWYWSAMCVKFNPPEKNVVRYVPEKSFEFVLWRGGQFQAELVVLFPHVPVQPHSHPNVDAREYHPRSPAHRRHRGWGGSAILVAPH